MPTGISSLCYIGGIAMEWYFSNNLLLLSFFRKFANIYHISRR